VTDLEAHEQSVSMAVVFVGSRLMHINKQSMFTAVSLFGKTGCINIHYPAPQQ
jgi:hypothetical protein